jgi:hypothetical protein
LEDEKIVFKTPVENPNWIPSFDILNFQAGTCGYELIPNIKPLADDQGEGLPW